MIEANVSGGDPTSIEAAAREVDERITRADGDSLLWLMGRVADQHGVMVTLSVYPPSADDDAASEPPQ